MENMEFTQRDEVLMSVNHEIKDYLLETSKWGKLLAIVGYIVIGLLILLGFGVIVGFSVFGKITHIGFPMGFFGIVYILIAVLYYFPVNYLNKFSDQIKKGVNSNDQQSVTSGFGNLKSLFKFMGIFTIVVLSMYALALITVLPLTLLLNK
jgi:hypothetical protein